MNEYIKKLSQRIAFIKEPKNRFVNQTSDGIKMSNSWNASLLFAELVYEANPEPYFTFENLVNLRDEFEKKKGISIDLDRLIEWQWVRIVHGNEVRLPSFLQKLLWDFPERIEPSHPEFFKKHVEELTFLNEVYLITGFWQEMNLVIDESKARNIIEEHQSTYQNCPDFEAFIEGGFLEREKDTDCLILRLLRGRFEDAPKMELFKSNMSYVFSLVWEKVFVNKGGILDWIRRVLAHRIYGGDLIQYVSKEGKEAFFEKAWKLLSNEPDLRLTKFEIDKCWWDNEFVRQQYGGVFPNSSDIPYELNNSSLFNLYYGMYELSRIDQSDLFWKQDVRRDFGLLISIIIENDSHYQNYRYVHKLFEESRTSPYILWDTTYIIKDRYPEIIPYLLRNKDLIGIGMDLLSQLQINTIVLSSIERDELEVEREESLSQIWSKCLHVASYSLRDCSNYEIGVLLVNITKPLIRKVFRERISPEIRSVYVERYQKTLNCFFGENEGEGLSYHNSRAFIQFRNKDELLESIIGHINSGDKILPHSKYKSVSLWKYKLLIDLVKGMKKHVVKDDDITGGLINSIFDIYKKDIQEEEIKFHSGLLREVEVGSVVWMKDVISVNQINWDVFLLELNQLNRIDEFFNLALGLYVDMDSEGNEKTQCFRLRFHLSILLESYHSVVQTKVKSLEISSLEETIRLNIVMLVRKHGTLIFKPDIGIRINRSINLFAYVFELSNFFDMSNRLNLIKSVVSVGINLSQYIIMYNAIHSEEDKEALIKEVEKVDIDGFIKSSFWLPELETALIEAVNSGLFIEQAKKILSFYEDVVTKKKLTDEKQQLIFEIKLIIALHEKNKDLLDAVPIPKSKHRSYGSKPYNFGERKKFVEGVMYLNNDEMEKAFGIFSALALSNIENPNYLLIKLYTSLKALQLKERTISNEDEILKSIQEIYSTTESVEEQCIKEKTAYEVNWVLQILLNCCKELDLEAEFYNIYYSRLDKFQRIHPDYLGISIPFFIQIGRRQEAMALLDEAREYHAKRSRKSKFILELEQIIFAEDIPEYYASLRNSYREIITLPLDKMIKAIPLRVNPYSKNLDEFILYEICFAVNQLLNKLKAIEAVFGSIDLKSVKEDYFTDLIELGLNAQFKSFCYKLDSQTRKGASGTGKSIGEIDLGLQFNVKDIVLEAVRAYSYQSWNTNAKGIVEHIEKTFNYSTSRDMFYDLIYYQNDNFNKDWSSFLNEVLPSIRYPKDFNLKGNVKDITNEFGNNSVKVAIANHESALTVYHIFINLNYLK